MLRRAKALNIVLLVAIALINGTSGGAAPAANALNRDPDWKQWNGSAGTRPAEQIAACTARIQSGQEKPGELFVAYYNRALTKYRLEQYQTAAEDYGAALRLKP